MICQKHQFFLIFFCIQILILTIVQHRGKINENKDGIDLKGKLNRSSLFDIGMKYQTDKVFSHHYETLYEKYLSQYRDTSIRLLEIGLGCGMDPVGASAQTWREYLGIKADIHFLEVNEICGKNWENSIGKQLNVILHYGSQENVTFLEEFKFNMQQFDIIIDDGGHTMNQQQTSFMTLLSLVRSGGLYVIEDLETSYNPTYRSEYFSSSTTTIELIKTFVDEIQQGSPTKTISSARNVFSFEIADGICIFTVK